MKVRKTLLLSSVLITALIAGCKKDAPAPVTTNPGNQSYSAMAKDVGKLDVCYGYTLKNDNGEYSCPSGSGCAKITKGGCNLAGGGGGTGDPIMANDYDQFKKALDKGKLDVYFSSAKWHDLFPRLMRRPKLLSHLQNGTATFVEQKNSAGSLMYLAIPTKLIGKFSITDVKYAMELPSGIL